MKFLREDTGAATQAIAKAICDGLFERKRVLWLVSGGSNALVEKNVMDAVSKHAAGYLGGLAILPIDERYGKRGHKDSNVQQLHQIGFDPSDAIFIDVLMHDAPLDQTVKFYNNVISTSLDNADLVIGQFGMGADGHIAGIKPGSPASKIADGSIVTGYEWSDYIRMTLMPEALRRVTVGFLLAYGADKKKALTSLKRNAMEFEKLPAVLLYELPDVYVYNDQIESEG